MPLPVTELWQVNPGDAITVPGYFAGRMTVLSLTWDDPDGDYLCLSWTSPCGQGTQHLTSLTGISLISRVSREPATSNDEALAELAARIGAGNA